MRVTKDLTRDHIGGEWQSQLRTWLSDQKPTSSPLFCPFILCYLVLGDLPRREIIQNNCFYHYSLSLPSSKRFVERNELLGNIIRAKKRFCRLFGLVLPISIKSAYQVLDIYTPLCSFACLTVIFFRVPQLRNRKTNQIFPESLRLKIPKPCISIKGTRMAC